MTRLPPIRTPALASAKCVNVRDLAGDFFAAPTRANFKRPPESMQYFFVGFFRFAAGVLVGVAERGGGGVVHSLTHAKLTIAKV